jgi:hypothetical protein
VRTNAAAEATPQTTAQPVGCRSLALCSFFKTPRGKAFPVIDWKESMCVVVNNLAIAKPVRWFEVYLWEKSVRKFSRKPVVC